MNRAHHWCMKAYSEDLRAKILDAVDGGMPKSEAARAFGLIISSVQRYVATGLSSKLAGWGAAGFMLGGVGWIVIYPCLEVACLIGPIPMLSAKRNRGGHPCAQAISALPLPQVGWATLHSYGQKR